MGFLKAAWSFIRGVKDVLVLCFLLLFFGALYGALSMSTGERRPSTTQNGALLLKLEGSIVEQPHDVDPFALAASNAPVSGEYKLRDILTALDAARTNSGVKAVVLNLDGFTGGGHVTLERVGKALDALRAAKKPVLTYATAYEDDGYQLAAHASEVWLNPLGGVAIMGPGGSQLYYKGLIDKLGITANIYRVGTYKSAVEPFLRADQSPAAKDASRALAGAIWQNWQDDVQRARPKAKLSNYVNNPLAVVQAASGNLANAALSAGLVDKLGDETSFAARVATFAGADDDADSPGFASIDFAHFVKAHTPANDGQIGVLTVSGEIVDGETGAGGAGGDTITALLHEALATQDLKALVVRVDSPGGSVLASEKIRAAIAQAKAQGLPIVTSMGDVAASGGYWIATPSDKIVAQPSTITGSIGVFGILPSFEGVLAKLGVTSDGVKTTPLSGEPNVLGGISPDFNTISQLGVEDMYHRFIGLVSKSRRLTPERVDSIAQGRVWDGGTARQLGLVDQFGGLDEAIALAAKLAKLDPAKAKPFYIEPVPDRFSMIVASLMSARIHATGPKDLIARQAWKQHQITLRALNDARMLSEGASMQAACLECAAYGSPAAVSKSTAYADSIWGRWIKMLIN